MMRVMSKPHPEVPFVLLWHSVCLSTSGLTDVVLVPARREPVLHRPAVGGVDRGAGEDALALQGRARVYAAVSVPLR